MDMFIEIKFPVNTHTQNIYCLCKRNVYTPQWNLNICIISAPWEYNSLEFIRVCFHRVFSKPFRHNLGFILQLGTEHANVFMGDADTIIIGVIIQIAFGYEIEYIVEKNVKKSKDLV